MNGFYDNLLTAPIKAEALRQAQLKMIKGTLRIENNKMINGNNSLLLPPELTIQGTENFSHPYYWAGFALIGSPW